MADVYLVKVSYLKSLAGINDNVDFDNLKSTIIMVQDIYIQQILGTTLYEDLKTKIISDDDLSSYPNEKTLINDYIAKVLVWYLKMESTPAIKFKYANKGVMVKSGENAENADSQETLYLMDKWRIIAERYAQLLTDYLIANQTLFPKYLEHRIDGMKPKLKNFTSGIYLKEINDDECLPHNGSMICLH